MEVECSKVKDRLIIFNKIMLHQGQQQGLQREDNQGQKRSQLFEDQMLNYMAKNKRIINLHEQKFVEIVVFQANTIVFQANTNASLKNLET